MGSFTGRVYVCFIEAGPDIEGLIYRWQSKRHTQRGGFLPVGAILGSLVGPALGAIAGPVIKKNIWRKTETASSLLSICLEEKFC